MAVAFESAGAVGFCAANNNNAISLTLPSTRPTGSVLLCVLWNRLITASVTTAPSGYTLLSGFPLTSGTAAGGRIWVYAKEVVGGESAPSVALDGTTGTSGDIWGGAIVCYSGVDLSLGIANILDGTPTATDASGTTTCTYPALSITRADSMIVRTLARFRDAADTFTFTATWNERLDSGSTNRLGGQQHLQDKLATASGSQASVTVAPSNTTAARYLAVTLALEAAPPIVPLTAAASLATPTLALTAATKVVLGAVDALASSTLALTVPALLPLETATGASSATLDLTTPAPPSAYEALVMALTPALYWRLGDAEGLVAQDATANDRDGTADAGIAFEYSADLPPVIDDGDTAAVFTDDQIGASGVQSGTAYNPFVSSSVRTFTGWAWRDAGSATDGLCGGMGDITSPGLQLSSGNQNVVWRAAGSGAVTWTNAWPGDAQWVHWALVYDDSTLSASLYINGSLVSAKTVGAAYGAAGALTGNIHIGGSSGSAPNFTGRMDEFAVFEYALDAAEILSLYQGPSVGGETEVPLDPAAGLATPTLAITAPTGVPLATATSTATPALALTAPARFTLEAAASLAAPTLALRAPTRVTLETATSTATPTLALTAAAKPTLETASAVATPTLALRAATRVVLETASALTTPALTVTIPGAAAEVPLAPASAIASPTLALRAETRVTLGTAAAVATPTLALTAPARLTLGAAACAASPTIALAAPTQVPLGAATSTASPTLALKAPTQIPLAASAAQSSGTLGITAGPGVIPAQPATAVSTANLALRAATRVTLDPASAAATASLALTAPVAGVQVQLGPAAATAAPTLALRARTLVVFDPASGQAIATLALTAAPQVILGPAGARSTATLNLITGLTSWPLDPEGRWLEGTDTRWPADDELPWPVTTEERWILA